MKKIILLLFALFLSFSAYSQFPNPGIEGFENTSGPEALPSTTWNLGTGVPGNQWAVFDNGIGTGRWTINDVPANVHQGVNSGYINRVQTNGANLTSQNYLATPLVTIPNNGQLRFWARTFTNGNNGTFYDIKWAPNGPGNQTNPGAYTNNLVTYTEDQLTLNPQGVQNPFNVYTLKIINFPAAMYGSQVYISFIRRNTQDDPTTIDGDRWLIDDIQLNERCLDPTGLGTAGVLSTSANLTWGNPSGATSWEIEVLPAAGTATGAGVTYSGSLPYTASSTTGGTPAAFVPNTCYKYFVRAICSGTGTNTITSDWVGPFNFCTTTAPPVCGGNYVDPGGPTANYPNNVTAANGTTVICPTNPGDQVTVTFTSFNTQANLDTLSIYDGSVVTPTALLGTFSGTTLPPAFTSSAANGCLTFVFVSNATVTAAGWIANVTCAPPPPCPKPTALTAIAVTPTTINLGWTNIGPGTSWQYIVLPCNAPAPTPATVGISAPTNPFLITGLTSGTCYNIYVRSDCTSTSNGLSAWSNVLAVTTTVAPPVCGGNFVDPGGVSANYAANTNSTVTICPTTPGDIVTVTFTAFALENGFDFLTVYDGSAASGVPIANLTGTTIPGPFTATSASGCLTFVFTSDASTQLAGWLANVTCTTPPPCQQPTALVASAVLSNTATLSWTNVGVGTSWQVLALPCTAPPPTAGTTGWIQAPGGSPYVFTGLSPATCYNLYVRSDCDSTSNGVSLWSGPISVTTQVAPPICGGNFVDSGGPTGNYANNTNSTITICPTIPGEQVTVTFTSFWTEANWDGLYVYNGNTVTPGALLPSGNGVGLGPITIAGAYWGNLTGANLPGPFTSSAPDGCLTFVFITDGSIVNPGFLANVTCAPPPTCAKPITLTATVTGTTTATLNWVQPANPGGGTATQWMVVVQPAGGPPPLPGAGVLVTGTPTYLATGLTPNTNYEFYVQAVCSGTDSSPWAGPRTFFMTSSCTSSQPFCGDTGLVYPNTTGQPSYGNIGCLFTTPNPAWYFMQVNQSGNLTFQIAQTNGAGGGIDVDFICWGPFTPAQYSTLCSNIYDFPDGNTGIPNNVVACSYSAAPIENFTIPNAVSGNYYMVLITNFSNQAGSVTFNQTGGTGNTNCAIVCNVALGPDVVLCSGASHTITATTQGATGYTWYFNNSPTPIPGQTGSTLVVTQSGNYTCIIACGLNTAQDTVNVTFTTPITPTFNLPSTVCQGLTAPTLPTSSSDLPTAITGTWSPATVDTSVLGTTAYTFTPTAGQCADVYTFNITIVPASVTTTFNPIPNICQGLPAPALPASSTNVPAITGTWSPLTIDTSTVGTTVYTFTPAVGQCATVATLSVTIDAPSIVPTFNAIPNICQGGAAPVLPTSSTNQPTAITGTWNPSTVDTSVIGTVAYTFTPDAGQCAVPATINITVVAPVTATFTQIPGICQGGTAPALPTSSNNQPTVITGTWSPSTIDTSVVGTVVYTFTPGAGQCAVGTTMSITIHPTPDVLPVNGVNVCDSYTLPPLSVGDYFSSPNGVGPITNLTLTSSQLVYVYAQSNTVPNCTDQESFQVNITPSPQYIIEGGCENSVYVLHITNANFNTDTATYVWTDPNGNIINNNTPHLVTTISGVYTCSVSVFNGSNDCTTPQTFDTTGKSNCEIPKGISPNGDGLNDRFDLAGFNVGKLGIFNRYGKAVYTKTDYKDEWGGQSDSGNDLPDGTYYYVIERKDGGDTRTGWIFINREIR